MSNSHFGFSTKAFGFPSLQSALLLLIAIVATTFFAIREIFKPVDRRPAPQGKKWKLPPGPAGWPIIGNLLELQAGPAAAADLGKYGEMTTTHLGSKLWVLLNSSRVVNELYNRRGSITNERPHLPVVSGLISRDNRSVMLPAATWSERRRIMHQVLSGSATIKYTEYQDMESHQLLAEYLHRPKQWYLHHGRYSNSVIHRITLGHRVAKVDKKLASLFRVQTDFILNVPPLNFIDCFPQLSKLPRPLQWWRKRFEAIGQMTFDAYQAYWAPVRQAIEDGSAAPSFARDVLTGKEAKFSGSDDEAMYLAIQLIEAGSDTTRAALNIFVMAAICHPETAAKARQEVDLVCGARAERLPDFADEKQMPYVCALIKELMRWRPILIWSPEHTSSQDLEFEGYHFPAGTGFLINHSAICSNPHDYHDPAAFKPERWLDGHESDVLHGLWAFGGGRRVCVGYRLAQKSLFINIARLVYCYDFEAAGPIDPENLNHFTQAEPFPVLPRIRSEKHGNLVVATAEAWDVLKYVDG